MQSKISPQTKSFIILFTLAVVGTYICIILYRNQNSNLRTTAYSILPGGYTPSPADKTESIAVADAPVPKIDISSWSEYTNKDYGFSFKYKPEWKIAAGKKVGEFSVIEVDPGAKYYNFKIYISTQEFYIMNGLPLKHEIIGGVTADNASDLLFGIKKEPYFLTFDLGYSLSLKPEFNAMVKSVSFVK